MSVYYRDILKANLQFSRLRRPSRIRRSSIVEPKSLQRSSKASHSTQVTFLVVTIRNVAFDIDMVGTRAHLEDEADSNMQGMRVQWLLVLILGHTVRLVEQYMPNLLEVLHSLNRLLASLDAPKRYAISHY